LGSAEIVVVGSYNRDVVLTVEHLPKPGETCFALARSEGHGGKGSNQALQAALCGGHVSMLAALGDDAAGAGALAEWAHAGIDTRHCVRLTIAPTGGALVVVDAKGENSIIVDAGANALLSPADVNAAADTICAARLVLAQLETPVDATARAFELARSAGVMTFLNAAPASSAIDAELLPLTDVLFVNELEAVALAGGAGLDHLQASLLPKVARAVVMTLGAEGVVMLEKDAAPLARPALTIDVVDTTGAGDAFIGAFVAKAAAGELSAALDWGVAAGALACSRAGAASSYSRAPEIARRAAQLPAVGAGRRTSR
jgi:ribokinase